jgi:UDPglucose 6-dehydrogenase
VEPKILKAVMQTNDDRRSRIIVRLNEIIPDLKGKPIGVFGLAFKPNTDDMRDAPSIDVIQSLQAQGAKVRAYDPVAMQVAAPLLPGVEMKQNAYQVAEGADAVVVTTEWNEFKQLDLVKIRDSMKQPVIVDGRNIYEPAKMAKLGFTYRGVGRGYNPNGAA